MSNDENDWHTVVADLEATVEGLGQQNTELQHQVDGRTNLFAAKLGVDSDWNAVWSEFNDVLDERYDLLKGNDLRADALRHEIQQHKTRYANAIKMIQRRQEQLNLERESYRRLAQQYTELADRFVKITTGVAQANNWVRDLQNVNTVDLDNAIEAVADAIDRALLV